MGLDPGAGVANGDGSLPAADEAEHYTKRVIEGSDLLYYSRSNKDGWDPVALLHLNS